MDHDRYREIAGLVLSSWESGRLKGLWESFAEGDDMGESGLLKILAEADALAALNAAEAAETRLHAAESLRRRIKRRALEESVRSHLAANPRFIGTRWDAFAVEKGVATIAREQANKAGLTKAWGKAGSRHV